MPLHINMRLLFSSFARAALALVASAAPAAPVALDPEVTTDLPARFGLIIVTAEERVNGRRLQYVNSWSTPIHIRSCYKLTNPCCALLRSFGDRPQCQQELARCRRRL